MFRRARSSWKARAASRSKASAIEPPEEAIRRHGRQFTKIFANRPAAANTAHPVFPLNTTTRYSQRPVKLTVPTPIFGTVLVTDHGLTMDVNSACSNASSPPTKPARSSPLALRDY